MSSTIKTKKLIQQQINSGILSSYFNKSQINKLNVGTNNSNIAAISVTGNETISGVLVSKKIGINTINPTQLFEVNNCNIFNGQISIGISSPTPFTSLVTGVKTKFEKRVYGFIAQKKLKSTHQNLKIKQSTK